MKNKTKNHRVFTKCPQFCGHFFCSLDFYSANRDENFCYQFMHGQKLMPQFRKIIVLVCAPLAQADNLCVFAKCTKGVDISFVAFSDNKKHSFECFSIQIYIVCVKRRGIEKLAHRYSQTVCKHNHGFQSNVFGASLHNAFYCRKRNSAQYCKTVLSDIFLFKILT